MGVVRYIYSIVFFLLLPVSNSLAETNDAAELFENHSNRIYQIRLIDLASQKKSSLGSGFLISDNGVIATNYHVIEGAITYPGKYRIEYLTVDDRRGEMTLLDVDVVNDLAILRAEDLTQTALELAEVEPPKGTTIYSIGNPHDIGFTVVPGTYNGIDEKSFYKRIHFSGSINSGMSGGPVLNAEAEVVGVNVSTAGNGIGFLVPVAALNKLFNSWGETARPIEDFKRRIGEQLRTNQQDFMSQLLSADWRTEALGEANTLSDLPPFVKCWGGSSDEKKLYLQVSSFCQSDQQVYLNHHFTTGGVNYQFFWLEAAKLNSWQFYNFYQRTFSDAMPDNHAGKRDVGNFVCEESFVESSNSAIEKIAFCTRAYRNYSGLFDVLFIGGGISEDRKAFVRHFTLAGVSKDNAKAFMGKFMEVTTWQ